MKIIFTLFLATALATTTPDIIGVYEYKSIDESRNHYIMIEKVDGTLKAKYFGTHDGKEHGVYFYKVDVEKLKIGDHGELEFEIGTRWLYETTQFKTVDQQSDSPMGRTSDILKYKGQITDEKIKLTCNSDFNSCWGKELIFVKIK